MAGDSCRHWRWVRRIRPWRGVGDGYHWRWVTRVFVLAGLTVIMLGCDVNDPTVPEVSAAQSSTVLPSSPTSATPSVQPAPTALPARAYLARAVAAYDRHDPAGAIASYSQALILQPDLADAYLGRGIAYYAQGQLDQADADLTRTLSLRPEDGLAACNRGLVRRDRGQHAAALADFRACLAQSRDTALRQGAAKQIRALEAEREVDRDSP